MTPFFSIVIPTLNEEKFLPRILDILAKQQVKNFEVIVSDGRSTDNTQKAALAFKNKLALSFYQTDVSNVSVQRNAGAAHARGEYILFLDADSSVDDGFIRKLTSQIKESRGSLYIPRLMPQQHGFMSDLLYKCINIAVAASIHTPREFSTGGSMAVRTDVFRALGGFDSRLHVCEDHDLVRRAHRGGATLHMTDAHICFSLRRLQHEGILRVTYKFLYSSLVLVIFNRLPGKLYEHPMGGHLYESNR